MGAGCGCAFQIYRSSGAGAAFLDCCGAGASAGAVFYKLFSWIGGAGAVFFKIFECGCETAPAPALRSLLLRIYLDFFRQSSCFNFRPSKHSSFYLDSEI